MSENKIKIEDLLEKFNHEVWEERKKTSDIISKLGSPVVPHLINSLKTDSDNMRYWSIRTLGEISTPDALKAILLILDSKDYKYRTYAVQALKNCKNEIIINKLADCLDDPSWEVANNSAQTLECIGAVAIPILIRRLKKSSDNVSFWIIKIISKVKLEILVQFLKYKNRSIRLFITEALGDLNSMTAIKLLLRFLDDQYWDVKQNAVDSLVKIGDKVIEPLLHYIKGKDSETYLWAEKIFDNIEIRMITPLINLLKSGDRDIKVNVAKLLGNTNDNRVIGPLIEALSDKSWFVAKASANALVRLGNSPDTKHELADLITKIIKDPTAQSNLRYWAVFVLTHIGDDAVKLLLEGIEHEEKEIRQTIVKAMGEARIDAAVETLVKCLNDQSWPVRDCAAKALVNYGSRIAITLSKYLLEQNEALTSWVKNIIGQVGYESVEDFRSILMNSTVNEERMSSAMALGIIGGKVAIDTLVYVVLNDRDDWVRRAAAMGLSEITDVEAIPALLQLLDDKSEEIISFSVEALSKIGGDAVKDKLVAELENNPNPEKEFYIYTALAQLGVEDAFLPVVDGLDKENENVMVRTVMKAIERIGKPIVPFLVEQLTRKEWHVRNRVQISLTKMGHDILDDLKEIRDANDDKDVKFWLNKIIREIEKKDEILRK